MDVAKQLDNVSNFLPLLRCLSCDEREFLQLLRKEKIGHCVRVLDSNSTALAGARVVEELYRREPKQKIRIIVYDVHTLSAMATCGGDGLIHRFVPSKRNGFLNTFSVLTRADFGNRVDQGIQSSPNYSHTIIFTLLFRA